MECFVVSSSMDLSQLDYGPFLPPLAWRKVLYEWKVSGCFGQSPRQLILPLYRTRCLDKAKANTKGEDCKDIPYEQAKEMSNRLIIMSPIIFILEYLYPVF